MMRENKSTLQIYKADLCEISNKILVLLYKKSKYKY